MLKRLFLFAVLCLVGSLSFAAVPARDKIADDLATVENLRNGLISVVEYVRKTPEIFHPKNPKALPPRDDKVAALQVWRRFLDYRIALDTIEEEYSEYFFSMDGATSGDENAAFEVHYAAFLAQYRWSLEFLKELESYPYADTAFNETLPDLGLPAGSYADFKLRFLNVGTASRFAALNAIDLPNRKGQDLTERSWIKDDRDRIWSLGKGKGLELTAKNALEVVKGVGQVIWLPVQTDISKSMGRMKVARRGQNLITAEQAQELGERLEPGDIFLERREWYMSNAGIPGFWTHAALYIGTADDRRKFFGSDEVKEWVKEQGVSGGDFEELIKTRFPSAYTLSLKKDESGYLIGVLEAIEKGVTLTSLVHSATADSVAVLRPRLPKKEKALAVLRAFSYEGRPYDYNFDFLTDSALVCSELVYKSYEPAKDFHGVVFPQSTVMGRIITSPNEFARQFDEEKAAGKPQTDLVAFLDGYEDAKKAVDADEKTFRESWRRPKWHILVQEKRPEK
ncbi:hypothetical protein EPN96_01130 [bacterium]|nr:MAG: hypothetical protein EPN96_01130 [bacterium]